MTDRRESKMKKNQLKKSERATDKKGIEEK